jgi:hypothetical protein
MLSELLMMLQELIALLLVDRLIAHVLAMALIGFHLGL